MFLIRDLISIEEKISKLLTKTTTSIHRKNLELLT